MTVSGELQLLQTCGECATKQLPALRVALQYSLDVRD